MKNRYLSPSFLKDALHPKVWSRVDQFVRFVCRKDEPDGADYHDTVEMLLFKACEWKQAEMSKAQVSVERARLDDREESVVAYVEELTGGLSAETETPLLPWDPRCGNCTSAHDVACKRHAPRGPYALTSDQRAAVVALVEANFAASGALADAIASVTPDRIIKAFSAPTSGSDPRRADPATSATGASPGEDVPATAAGKPGSGDGGERPALVCGQNAFFSPESEGGCAKPIGDERTALYRCAFCHIPFHVECLKKHIANEPPLRRHAEEST